MIMRVVIDIEATGLLNSSSIDYSTIPYKLKSTFKVHCIVVKDIDTGEFYKFYEETLKDFPEFSERFTLMILHNGISYDLRVLQLYYGLDYKITSTEDWFNARKITIVDTLVLSKLLNPDRGGHSLKWWGSELKFSKGNITTDEDGEDIPDVWEEFSLPMLEYCERDVELTHKVYDALTVEAFGADWREAHRLEKFVAYYINLYSHYGFKFDRDIKN
jgi:DNA polymerase III alpha subunit (gram-positive type)